ncbi:RNA helicase like protein [Babesia gibsoni]|uniref:ATP-dependent RNA helicase n=1 Tax=Babesia gibsoni TaxID=33632 RepID=A0AAD8LMB0_BABGI|nr:RNA helicase like protein [Babesia gibsoni]
MAQAVAETRVSETLSLWVNRLYQLELTQSNRTSREILQEFDVHPHILDVLESHEITNLLPVQEKVIPFLLNASRFDRYSISTSDLVITAPTGQGKTLCYLLPVVDGIIKHKCCDLTAIVIAPTRELARQTYDFCIWFMDTDRSNYDLRKGALLKAHCCHGSASFLTDHLCLLNDSPQIVIFTPGRFVEHFNHRMVSKEKSLSFKSLKWIIIDEVDALLAQSFYNWTSAICAICEECREFDARKTLYSPLSHRPQKILVSATIPTKSSEMDLLQLNRPLLLKAGETVFTVPTTLHQKYLITTNRKKLYSLVMLMYSILHGAKSVEKAIVFSSQKETTHRIARTLEIFFKLCQSGIDVLELSSIISTKQRGEVLQSFQEQKTMCLVCSDVGSRGMNFPQTNNIINFDFPKSSTRYIHRIGRTARANNMGTSYALLDQQTEDRFNALISDMKIPTSLVEQVHIEHMLPNNMEEELLPIFNKTKDMADRCIELEGSGFISHDMPLPSSWESLLEKEQPEQSQ